MSEILSNISTLFIPVLVTVIIGYGFFQKAPVYDYFIEGTRDGLKTALSIVPYIIGIFMAIEVFKVSGTMDFIVECLRPVLDKIGFPTELVPFVIMKPISGSGSLVVIEQIINDYGADSYLARTASVMMGSAETIFYTLAVYFGVTHVKNMRYVLIVAFIGYGSGILASIVVCSFI